MQKNTVTRIMREEVLRAFVFALAFFAFLSVGFVSIAYASNGGKFWELLNKILASGNWESDTTGTVKNSEKLWNKPASEFVQIPTGGFSCPVSNQCIYKIGTTGTPECR
jgi:hypothetical protein